MKKICYITFSIRGILGTLLWWLANAETTITQPYGNIHYTLNWNKNFDAQFITITNWTDIITILDRNLWATSNNISESNSYWYHFQWWNNYWFKPCTDKQECNTFPNGEHTWNIQVSESNITIPYTNWVFYIGTQWKLSNWVKDSSSINLWWWNVNFTTDLFSTNWERITRDDIISLLNDQEYTNSDNRKVSNAQDRQWPCPEWFHVPSIWEYIKLLDMLDYYKQNTWTRETIHGLLKIPFAGVRSYDWLVYGSDNATTIWSSSPYSTGSTGEAFSYSLYMDSKDGFLIPFNNDYRSKANSVRCFYNEYAGYISEITNIDITWITNPTLWNIWITWWITVTTTPDNAINFWATSWTTIYKPFSWWAYETGRRCALGDSDCETFSATQNWNQYQLRFIYTPKDWYKLAENFTVTTDGKGNIETWYNSVFDFYTIRIKYLPSEIPIWIDHINLSWNILPLIHWTIPSKNITTNTTGIQLWNITWWKWDNCTPLADEETIDASNSKYCLSIDITTASWYTTTFDYEIFLNNGHRIGYYDGDDAYACTSSLIKNQKITPQYKIDFISSWEIIDTRYRAHGCTLANCISYWDNIRVPHREWYTFTGWFSDENFNNKRDWDNNQITGNITLYAKWIENLWTNTQENPANNHVSWGYSWWGRHITLDSWDTNDEHKSADDEYKSRNDNQDIQNGHPDELKQSYEFAYKNWITTMDTIDNADMYGPLTRIAMAKMLSQYAINVLNKKPVNTVVPHFLDMNDKLDEEYNYWVTLAYQLGIMWINIEEFRPFDLVTRAEFGTALSRMLYWTPDWEYENTELYYTNHLKKLIEEWIITNDNPNMQELRWYVMIMLKRATKN